MKTWIKIFSPKTLLYLEIQKARLSEFLCATAAAFQHCRPQHRGSQEKKPPTTELDLILEINSVAGHAKLTSRANRASVLKCLGNATDLGWEPEE